jgi:hypothetical protein
MLEQERDLMKKNINILFERLHEIEASRGGANAGGGY